MKLEKLLQDKFVFLQGAYSLKSQGRNQIYQGRWEFLSEHFIPNFK